MVDASRRHLTERYASGVDLLLWETEKRLVPEARLGLDRLEGELFDAAQAMGMRPEAIAAVLDLPDGAAAEKRHRWLETRRALPYGDLDTPSA